MWLTIIDLFSISLIYSLIGQNVASNIFTFGQKSVTDEYKRLKNSSVHRGIYLSLSAFQKNEICKDFYGPQLFILHEVGTEGELFQRPDDWVRDTHKQSRTQQYEHRLTVLKLRQIDDPLFEEETLSFECNGLTFEKREPISYKWVHVISAFRPKWVYSTKNNQKYENLGGYHLEDFVALSPDHVPLDQAELEKRYVNTLKTIMALGEEAQGYMKLIDKRDNLSSLSRKEKLLLCASILSSPVYWKEPLEFSLDWMYETLENKMTLDYDIEISIKSNPAADKIKINCILCTAFRDATAENLQSTNLYIARSYNDGNSVVTLKTENEDIFVDKSFKNIPILSTKRDDVDYGFLTLDFHLRGNQSN